jgi:anti-anti-sigma factor
VLQRANKPGSQEKVPFSVDAEPVFDGCHLVTIRGELDLDTAPALKGKLDELHDQSARTLIVSLEECTFVDSTGLQAVLQATKGLDDGGTELLLAGVRGAVRRVFETTGVTNLVLVFPTVEQAKRAALA